MDKATARGGCCQFFVSRKGRFCKMTVKKGHNFCGEHQPQNDSKSESSVNRRRIVCPNDPKHSCYAHLLAKHLKICNARPKENPEYIVLGINKGPSGTKEMLTLAEAEDEDVMKLIKKIKRISKECLPTITEEIFSHPALAEEVNNPTYGPSTQKHRLQNASLLGHIEQSNFVQPDTCFMEFGAGKGQLSYWLGKVVCHQEHNLMLLIDKAKHRNSLDKQLSFKSQINSQRLYADIADLCLAKVTTIREYRNMVAISKHLCGVGTDLALRCITADCSITAKIGVVMAPCCHHKGDWDAYVGQEFLMEHVISSLEFSLMCGVSSWATCGICNKKNEEGEYRQSERYQRLHLSPEDRIIIGKQCKQVLDYGRLKYLEKFGFKGKLVHYIREEISPENACIIAVKS